VAKKAKENQCVPKALKGYFARLTFLLGKKCLCSVTTLKKPLQSESCRRITYTPCVATGNKLTETFGEVLKRNNACSGIKPLVSRCGSHKTKHTQWPKQLPKTGNNICVHIYILGLKIADGECWHGISQDIVCTQRQMNCCCRNYCAYAVCARHSLTASCSLSD